MTSESIYLNVIEVLFNRQKLYLKIKQFKYLHVSSGRLQKQPVLALMN